MTLSDCVVSGVDSSCSYVGSDSARTCNGSPKNAKGCGGL
jgi:hypothetical protein